MKRGEPLRRRTPLARGLSRLKRTRINPISEKQRDRVAAAAAAVRRGGKAFHAAIRGEVCVVCERSAWEARAAGTKHQAHHAIRQEVLKRLHLEEYLWDVRLAVCVCEEPCHRRHTSRLRRIRRARLPRSVDAFVMDVGVNEGRLEELLHALELEYPE